jgi:very-short-patch-repair endonuclease
MTLRLKNNELQKERRRSLRKSETDAERKLWQILRNKQIEGLKFFRQYSVGKYILDFYCPKYRLAIEADGSQHFRSAYDDNRTAELKKLNIFVLRFWDNEILQNIEGVYEKIRLTIKSFHNPT